MKLRNKLIALLIMIAALFVFAAVSVSAEAEIAGEDGLYDIVKEDSESGSSGQITDNTDVQYDPGFFEVLYSEFIEHSEKILGALTLIGSLILAFAYKKGLIPVVRSGLNALMEAVAGIKEKTQENDMIYTEFSEILTGRLDNTEKTLESLGTRIDGLTDSLKSAEDTLDENAKLRIIMSAQVDMLYDIFVCSSLPEFQKERVCERIKEMKEALGGNANE